MPNITSVTGETGTYTYTYTIPAGVYALLYWLHAVYTASGDAGTRQVKLIIKDADGNLITDFHAGATQGASTTRHYNFMQGIYRETSFVNNEIQVPISASLVLEPGWTMTIEDDSGTDSATDVTAIDFQYEFLV